MKTQHQDYIPFFKKTKNYLAISSVILYLLLFIFVYPYWGIRSVFFNVLPVVVCSHFYGLKKGVACFFIISYLVSPLLLIVIAQKNMYGDYLEFSGIGLAVLVIIALVVGRLSDMKERVQLLESQISVLSRVDPLTHIYNRRAFYEYLEGEFIRSNRKMWEITHNGNSLIPDTFNGVFSIVLIDIDHFKSINDTFGHLVGDFVLKEISSLLKTKGIGFRDSDVVGRFSGEEFIVLLPDTTGQQALIPMERIHRKLKEIVFSGEKHEKFSVSFSSGIAQIKSTDVACGDIISRADKALHYAKKSGRAQFHFYDDLANKGISLYESSGRN